VETKLYRSRIVTFRTSPEEYDSLKKRSASEGARSVSEFARSVACCEKPDEVTISDPAKLDSLLTNLHETVTELNNKIEHLTEILVKKDE
jgi:hypothetical protein